MATCGLMQRMLKVGIVVVAIALFGLSLRCIVASNLDSQTDGTVIRIQQDLDNYGQDKSYFVFYQFGVGSRMVYNGVYLLENPTSLGDMPRMETFVSIRYSQLDPGINRPFSDDPTDLRQFFYAGISLILGACLLIAGVCLR